MSIATPPAPPAAAPNAPAVPAARRTARVTSAQLFAGANELQIDHRGAVYRLKQTSTGKLILTK